MLVCVFLCMFAHETAGAACIRHSPRPLMGEGGSEQQNSRELRGEIATTCKLGISELNQEFHRRRPGLEPGPIRRGLSVRRWSQISSATMKAGGYGSRLKAGTTCWASRIVRNSCALVQHPLPVRTIQRKPRHVDLEPFAAFADHLVATGHQAGSVRARNAARAFRSL